MHLSIRALIPAHNPLPAVTLNNNTTLLALSTTRTTLWSSYTRENSKAATPQRYVSPRQRESVVDFETKQYYTPGYSIMSLPASIVLPNTREGETIHRYALGQTDASYFDKDATPIFAENMVFNGLLFKMKGRDAILPLFADFVGNKIVDLRFEAIAEAGSKSRYMALYFVRLEGQEREMPVCDLLTLDGDGLIERLENCFDKTKCPQDIVDAGAPTLATFTD